MIEKMAREQVRKQYANVGEMYDAQIKKIIDTVRSLPTGKYADSSDEECLQAALDAYIDFVMPEALVILEFLDGASDSMQANPFFVNLRVLLEGLMKINVLMSHESKLRPAMWTLHPAHDEKVRNMTVDEAIRFYDRQI